MKSNSLSQEDVMGHTKSLLRSLSAIFLILFGGVSIAQDYPSQLVRIVVGYPPGGSTDNYARLIASKLQTAWGKSVIVENRPGASGLIGSEIVRKSQPDGYTLLFTSSSAQILSPLLMNPRPFDAVADFTPISNVVNFPLYLIVHPSIPVRSLREFVSFAKARPGQFNYSSSGLGGTSHLVTELFNSATGIKASHLPYKGTSPALIAVITGEAQYLFNNIGVSQPLVVAGKLRGLAITGNKRSPALPEIPTFGEAGVRGLENAYTWLGMLAPAKLPAAITEKLSTEVIRIMQSPDVEKRVLNDGYMLVANTPEQFAKEIQGDIGTWSRVIRENGIKVR